ncbi:MAG: DUF2231 domain-containing protein [Mucinivorans sp.]
MSSSMFHPLLVHFPIALLLVGFIFVTIAIFGRLKCKNTCAVTESANPCCIERAGYWLLVLGTLGAIASVLSGLFFTTAMDGMMGQKRDIHQLFAVMTMSVSIISAAVLTYHTYGKKKSCGVFWIGYILYAVVAVLVSITGHLGGMMVY